MTRALRIPPSIPSDFAVLLRRELLVTIPVGDWTVVRNYLGQFHVTEVQAV